jgi:hypothetical protein
VLLRLYHFVHNSTAVLRIQIWRGIVDKNTERKGITGEKTSRIRVSLTKKENNVIWERSHEKNIVRVTKETKEHVLIWESVGKLRTAIAPQLARK